MDRMMNRYWFDGIYKYGTLLQTMLSSANQHGTDIDVMVRDKKPRLYCLVDEGDEFEKKMDASIEAAHKLDKLSRGKYDPLYYC